MAYLPRAKRKIPSGGPIAWVSKSNFHQHGPIFELFSIEEGLRCRRRRWNLSIYVLVQTRFPTTRHKSETAKKGKSEKRIEESHVGGGPSVVPSAYVLFLKASWPLRVGIRNARRGHVIQTIDPGRGPWRVRMQAGRQAQTPSQWH